MTALIPHKVTLFFLAEFQRTFIHAYNDKRSADEWLFPQYPLWCFFSEHDKELFADKGKNVTSFVIGAPCFEKDSFFFPVTISASFADGAAGNYTSKIIFAKSNDAITKKTDFSLVKGSDSFPVSPRMFRIGTASLKDNGWSVNNDLWIKVK